MPGGEMEISCSGAPLALDGLGDDKNDMVRDIRQSGQLARLRMECPELRVI
jgi:hypothetical protein